MCIGRERERERDTSTYVTSVYMYIRWVIGSCPPSRTLLIKQCHKLSHDHKRCPAHRRKSKATDGALFNAELILQSSARLDTQQRGVQWQGGCSGLG